MPEILQTLFFRTRTPPPKEVICFNFGLFVCRSVWKSCERILTKFLGGLGHGPGTNEFNFGDDPDHHHPGVWSPKSAFTGLSKKLPTDYDEILWTAGLGCGLETNWLHFGDDPHHYPDRGVRSGSRSGSGKNCHVVNTQNRCPAKIIQRLSYLQNE